MDGLDSIIGTMVGARESPLQAATAKARALGRPYDPARVQLFEALFKTLHKTPAQAHPTASRDGIGNTTLSFFDAYFSNYIEGTEFEVSEAVEIVFGGNIPERRSGDAHDILGVWRIVSDMVEMRRVPRSASDLIDVLRKRHATVLAGRPEKSPGSIQDES